MSLPNTHRPMELRFLTTSLFQDFIVERNSKPVKRSYKDFLRGYGDYYAKTKCDVDRSEVNAGDDNKRWRNVYTEKEGGRKVLNNITINQINQNDYNSQNEMNVVLDDSEMDISNNQSRFTPKKCLEDYYFSSARFQPQPPHSSGNYNSVSNCICSPEMRTGYSCSCRFNVNPDKSSNIDVKTMYSQDGEKDMMNYSMDSDTGGMDIVCGDGGDGGDGGDAVVIDSGWIIDHGYDRDESQIKGTGNKSIRPTQSAYSSSTSSSSTLLQPVISSFFSKIPPNRQRSNSLKVSTSSGSISSNCSNHSLIENDIPSHMSVSKNVINQSNNSRSDDNNSYGQILRCRICKQDSPSNHTDKWTTCTFCCKQVCVACISSCEKCSYEFCKFCITLNFSGAFSRPMCIDCDRQEITLNVTNRS